MLYAHSGRYKSSTPSFNNRRPISRGRGGFRPSAQIASSRYMNQAIPLEVVDEAISQRKFTEFNLDPRLIQNIERHGYKTPTPIQEQIIPLLMAGRDVVGLANTGTGKTAAFLLPWLHKVLQNPQEGVLVVVPTRELAVQIADEFKNFAAGLPVSVMLAVGGMAMQPQLRALQRDPHFVIGTPGRLKDLIERRAINLNLFANIVLDEVDRMLDIGFIRDVQLIISHLPEVKQTGFFSATMTPGAQRLMQSLLKDPVTVSVQTVKTSEHIQQDVIKIGFGQNKVEVLYDLLRQSEFEKVIVFGRTKHGINKLERLLSDKGLRVCAIHGNKTQSARQAALQQFKRGGAQALLATDVAARGIDIPDVTHVINYDEPNSYEEYTHRIGRTGRAGKSGRALTFVG